VRGWEILNDVVLHNLHASPNIIRVIISRGMRWARHVVRSWYMRSAYNILVRKPRGRDLLEDLGVDGKVILE